MEVLIKKPTKKELEAPDEIVQKEEEIEELLEEDEEEEEEINQEKKENEHQKEEQTRDHSPNYQKIEQKKNIQQHQPRHPNNRPPAHFINRPPQNIINGSPPIMYPMNPYQIRYPILNHSNVHMQIQPPQMIQQHQHPHIIQNNIHNQNSQRMQNNTHNESQRMQNNIENQHPYMIQNNIHNQNSQRMQNNIENQYSQRMQNNVQNQNLPMIQNNTENQSPKMYNKQNVDSQSNIIHENKNQTHNYYQSDNVFAPQRLNPNNQIVRPGPEIYEEDDNHNYISEEVKNNIRQLMRSRRNVVLFYLTDFICNIFSLYNYDVTVDYLISCDVSLRNVQNYGIYDWQTLLDRGLSKEHLTRDKWLDIPMLKSYSVTIDKLANDLEFSVIEIIQEQMTSEELKSLLCLNVDKLIELGLNINTFFQIPFTCKQWIDDFGLKKHMLDKMGFQRQHYEHLVRNMGWPSNRVKEHFGVIIEDQRKPPGQIEFNF